MPLGAVDDGQHEQRHQRGQAQRRPDAVRHAVGDLLAQRVVFVDRFIHSPVVQSHAVFLPIIITRV